MDGLLSDCIDFCINEIRKPKNKQKLQKEVISPVLQYILQELKPYIFGLSIFLIITIFLLILLCYLVLMTE